MPLQSIMPMTWLVPVARMPLGQTMMPGLPAIRRFQLVQEAMMRLWQRNRLLQLLPGIRIIGKRYRSSRQPASLSGPEPCVRFFLLPAMAAGADGLPDRVRPRALHRPVPSTSPVP